MGEKIRCLGTAIANVEYKSRDLEVLYSPVVSSEVVDPDLNLRNFLYDKLRGGEPHDKIPTAS